MHSLLRHYSRPFRLWLARRREKRAWLAHMEAAGTDRYEHTRRAWLAAAAARAELERGRGR